jgi:hypothetical protein
MRINCPPASEVQIAKITEALNRAGLQDTYEERAHGERISISIRTNTFEEREFVRAVLAELNITEFFYSEEPNAA